MLKYRYPRVKLKLKWMWHEKFETDVPRGLQKKEIVLCYHSVRDTELVDCMDVQSEIEFWACLELLQFFISLPRNFQGPDKKPSQGYVQFSSVQSLSRVWLCDPMNRSTPGLPVYHQLPEFTQTRVHRVRDTIQASHPLSSHSPPAPNPSQHQSLFQWVNSSHEVAKVLEFQL